MQNDMRDRLIELYKEATTLYFDYLDSIDEKGLTDTEGRAKFTIDHLIANGVIVPPCKVGDTLHLVQIDFIGKYFTTSVIVGSKITMLSILRAYEEKTIIYMSTDKDQAEQKLKELSENGNL